MMDFLFGHKNRPEQPKKREEFFTVFVVPGGSSNSKRYSIPLKWYKTGRIIAGVLGIVFIFVIYDYANMRLHFGDMASLKKENTAQKVELQNLSAKIGELDGEFARLRTFDRKLRIIANIEKPASEVSQQTVGVGGVGGASPSEDYFLTPGQKQKELVGKMHSDISGLKAGAAEQEKSFTELQEFLLRQTSMLASTPSVWPARGWMTSTYGTRTDPFTGHRQMHEGLDIANSIGTPVSAPAAGVVTKVGTNVHLGKMIEITHGYGYKTIYGHLSQSYVGTGQRVKRGDKIAAIGNTGKSTGPHLHYEVVLDGMNVDPHRYILN